MGTKVSLKHYLHTSRGEKGELPIFLRITVDRKKAELHSGFKCTLKEWSEELQATKNNSVINQALAKQKAAIYELAHELNKENRLVSAAVLKDLQTGKTSLKIYLLEYFNRHIAEIKIRGDIKTISINKYYQSYNSLVAFVSQKYGVPDLPIDQAGYEFLNAYDLFLKQVYDLHKNTINKYHSRLRTLLLKANAQGIINKQPYANFKLNNVKTERTFLRQEELDKIIKLDISHNLSLDKVKDIFLFSCYTGLRFQDAQNLTTSNLTSLKRKPFLRYSQEKTGKDVDIPLLQPVINIIEKYKDSSERKILNKLLPKITNQKVNSYLKIIADQAGVTTTLTHHVARHTFATTVLLNNGVSMEDVSKMLGHSSLKTTSIYGRITQQRLLDTMKRVEKKIIIKGEKKNV